MKINKCPECGKQPEVHQDYIGYAVLCPDCYDPTPMHSASGYECPKYFGYNETSEHEAFKEWNEATDDFV